MNRLHSIFILVIIWCAFRNNFSVLNIALGLVVCSTVNYLVQPPKTEEKTFKVNLLGLLQLFLYTVYELIISSILVAREVLRLRGQAQPGIVTIPLACRYSSQKMLLANILTLTPGTLSIELTKNNSELTIHLMFADQKHQFINNFKQRLEPLVIKVFNYGND